MLLVMDTCSISVAPEPTGGFILKLGNIEGLPNTDILIPVQEPGASEVHKAISDLLNKLPTFTAADLKKEIR